MKKVICCLLLVISIVACNKNEEEEIEKVSKTTIMFLPWSNNLKSYFVQNIQDMKDLVQRKGLNDEKVIVCIETNPGKADIIEIKVSGLDTLKRYSDPEFTTSNGITDFLNRVCSYAPADTYAMIVGCHGTGWLPADKTETRSSIPDEDPMTRYLGGKSPEYQIDISTLKEGVARSHVKTLEYILFDNCYMSNIEVAYELKDVCRYIIASPTEIMAYGFPYNLCGYYIIGGVDYNEICKSFYDFYLDYSIPCGTISVTDCQELDSLAKLMKRINSMNLDVDTVTPIQRMDGYDPAIFYDLKDYVFHLPIDNQTKTEFCNQLDKVVPYKEHTEYYYSAYCGKVKIDTYCGITTSAMSRNTLCEKWTETSWYKDTH